mgnify:CR=1 FL=1
MSKPINKLLNPHIAVESYLDNLLHDDESVASAKSIQTKPAQDKPPVIFMPDLDVDFEKVEVVAEEATEDKIEEDAQGLTEPVNTGPDLTNATKPLKKIMPVESSRVITMALPETEEVVQSQFTENAQPFDRYQFPMQCLMFRVSGNQLSIPLIDMGSVLAWGSRITPLPHSPAWFLGLLIHRDVNVRVIDTARFLQIKETDVDNTRRHILVLGNESWAITCDQLGDVVRLGKSDVKWTKKSMSGYILGTIKNSLAILLDPEKILLQLNNNN